MAGEITPLAVIPKVAAAATEKVCSPKGEPGAFAKVLARVGKDLQAHETKMQEIGQHKTGTPLEAGELLALQSDVYRYSATVDLTSKLVAQGTQGVQTVVRSNGQ